MKFACLLVIICGKFNLTQSEVDMELLYSLNKRIACLNVDSCWGVALFIREWMFSYEYNIVWSFMHSLSAFADEANKSCLECGLRVGICQISEL